MTVRTASLEADLATIPSPAYVTAATVVALPPSDLDPTTIVEGTTYDDTTVYDDTTTYVAVLGASDQMRLRVNGVLVTRSYDFEMA